MTISQTIVLPERGQKLLLVEPAQIITSDSIFLLVLPGYDGDLHIENNEPKKLTYNFFCRNRVRIAELGYTVALVDSLPHLKGKSLEEIANWRRSTSAYDSLTEIMGHLKIAPSRTWVGAMSRSSEQIFGALNHDPSICRGMIILSTLTRGHLGTNALKDLPHSTIKSPALMIHHELDRCALCRPEEATRFFDSWSNPNKKMRLIKSGYSMPDADPCKGNSLHGFWGADSEVIAAIDDFLQASTN